MIYVNNFVDKINLDNFSKHKAQSIGGFDAHSYYVIVQKYRYFMT